MRQYSEQLLKDMAQGQKGHDLIAIVHGIVGYYGRSHPDTVTVA